MRKWKGSTSGTTTITERGPRLKSARLTRESSRNFSLYRTLHGMMAIFSRLFGIRFREIPPDQYALFGEGHVMTWHEEVSVYSVWDDSSSSSEGDFLGYLYLDLFPRDDKYNHAGHYLLQPGYTTSSGQRRHPASALVMNLPKPLPHKPSLLRHDEIRSLFHELGHAVHNLVSRVRYAVFHGTFVARDFVEIPSIMLENWWWTPAVVQELGYHYSYVSDGNFATSPQERPPERLDDETIRNPLQTRHLDSALGVLIHSTSPCSTWRYIRPRRAPRLKP
ncbi:hypothetical protein VTN96DRAFT_8055 [Rasamsonia emersonii]